MKCLNTLIVTKAFQMNRATAKSFVMDLTNSGK